MNEVLCGSLAERRRLEIIEAAERCVMKTGLHRLTLRDIAREQDGSLGNIYNYFANKEEIVEAIVERETDRFIAIAVQGGKAQGEGMLGGRLREHMTSFVDAYLDSDGARVAVSIAAEAMINERVRDIIARANQRLYEVISNDVINNRQNSWPIPKAKMQAQLALSHSLLAGLRVTAIFNPGIDRKELRAVAIDRLVHGILADLAASKGVTVEELSRWP